ncbi:MAG: DNA polymerase [Siphoviridae sp. ct7UA22]|nr:MAG: DNA polymerase [Siphoviridae sp. ct7UA22]
MRPQIDLKALLTQKRNEAPKRPKKYKTPNIKSLFLADENMIVADTDLAQADARVVAWEADDTELMQMFLDPTIDLHTENARAIFGYCPDKSHPNRKKAKAGVHAVNYHVGARTLAKALGITVHEADEFIRRWFQVHPKIADWHARIYDEMVNRRYIQNAFGFRKCFFGKTDGPTALSEALAWIPQSTVGNIINIAWMRMDLLRPEQAYVSMQVHDSLVSQHNKDYAYDTLAYLHQAMLVEVPYEKPLVIPTSLEVSNENIGELTAVDWDGCILDPDTGARSDRFWAHWPKKRLDFTKPNAPIAGLLPLRVYG